MILIGPRRALRGMTCPTKVHIFFEVKTWVTIRYFPYLRDTKNIVWRWWNGPDVEENETSHIYSTVLPTPFMIFGKIYITHAKAIALDLNKLGRQT